jgi:lipooligosaccharide transport system permease protein
MLVAIVFGLDPSWGMLLVPFIAFVAGFGWAAFGILISAVMKSVDNFSYLTSTVITPLFLVAGTFFPISGLPEWARVLANVNPLYHCVQLVRHAVFGLDWTDLYHLGFMVAFGLVAWRLATWRMEKRLIN